MGKKDPIVRTTVYLPRPLYERTKIMAVLTQRGLSEFIRMAIIFQLDKLKEDIQGKKDAND